MWTMYAWPLCSITYHSFENLHIFPNLGAFTNHLQTIIYLRHPQISFHLGFCTCMHVASCINIWEKNLLQCTFRQLQVIECQYEKLMKNCTYSQD